MKKALSGHAAAAAAIRSELKAEFPAVKFSVTSESFSMGNAVQIRWTDGPSTQVVDLIVKKYEYGHFDGMEDIYRYDNRRDDIPQAKYVSTSRKLSVGFIRAVAKDVGKFWGREIVINETEYGGWQVGDGLGPEVRETEDLIDRELRGRGEAEAVEWEANLQKRAWREKNVSALKQIGNEAERVRKDALDLGAGQAQECAEAFLAAEERGLSALADYYDEESQV